MTQLTLSFEMGMAFRRFSMKYVYAAVFEPAKEGGYFVYFPDLAVGATQGESLIECMDAAEKFLGDAMCFTEDEKRDIATPSAISDIKAAAGSIVTLKRQPVQLSPSFQLIPWSTEESTKTKPSKKH